MLTETEPIIDLKNCTLSIYKEGIILWKVKDNVEIDLDSAINITENTLKLANNKPFSIIVDTTNIFGALETDARKHFSTDKKYNELRVKSAAIVNSLPVRLLLNFYRRMFLKQDKLKIVTSYDEAIKWITT